MKKLVLSLFSLFLLVAAMAQKVVNDANAEPRSVGSFHAIHISNAFEVFITQSGTEGLAVSANDKDDIKNIVTTVSNGVLTIKLEQKMSWWPGNRRLRAYVSVKDLDELKISGACNVKLEGALRASTMKLDLSGASKLSGEMNVSGDFSADLSGASDLSLQGTASNITVDASGASDLKGYDFKATTCTVDASGASSVKLTVDKEVSAKLSGASSLSYKGTALIRDIKTSGASSISRKS